MGFRLPSSKTRHYLSGADWIIHALDYSLKTDTCAGNASQVVFRLDRAPDERDLEHHLNSFIRRFPVVSGQVARDRMNLAPYWRFIPHNVPGITLTVSDAGSPASNHESMAALGRAVNRPFEGEDSHIAFHMLKAGQDECYVAMTFDHRLFDARGAEQFLALLQEAYFHPGTGSTEPVIVPPAPAHLDRWMDKFRAGRNVNRKMIELSGSTVMALPLPPEKDRPFCYRSIQLPPEKAEAVISTAYSEAGYLMEMPYLLSLITGAAQELFMERGIAAESYLVPVSVDMRIGEEPEKEMFFNHVSYLFIRITPSAAADQQVMISDIKRQVYEQIKAGLPRDLHDASFLTRIAPLPVMKKLMDIPFGGNVASFIFSHVGKSSYSFDTFMDASVEAMFHMPRVPVPPGLGFFFNSFRGSLNLVIAWLEGLISEKEVSQLEADIRGRLGA